MLRKKATPNQTASRLKFETAASQACMRRSDLLQRLQIGLHGGVVDPQKLVCRSHHVDAEGFALSALSVHELVDRFIQRRVLQVDAHDEEQCPPQGRCTNFAHGFVPASHIAGIVRRSIQSSVGHQCFLGVKAAYIANFSYELWPERRSYSQTYP